MKDVDVEKVLVYRKNSSGEKDYKCLIDYLYDDDKVKSLHIMFPKATAHVKSYGGQAKWMYFLIKGK